MKLADIFSKISANFKVVGTISIDKVEVLDIAIDSRLVKKGSLFFALPGEAKNGLAFIDSAIQNGAVGIITQSFSDQIPQDVLAIESQSPTILLAEMLKVFNAPLPDNIYTVTGTNGKTSVAEFTRQIFKFLGKKAASIGTLGVVCDEISQDQLQSSALTTPDIVSLYKNLHSLKRFEVEDAIIEASSIGLKQGRMNGLDIDVAAFTNFTQDHIDYHGSMLEYFRCKMMLFDQAINSETVAVLNSDIKEFSTIKETFLKKGHKIIEYGLKAADLKLTDIAKRHDGQFISFEYLGHKYQFNLSVDGEFQAFNVLCALGIILAKKDLNHIELQALISQFSLLKSALGRMQHVVSLENKAQIFIDFAHTPDALENVLKLARKLTQSRVLVLFGCGGDRDAKKRPVMGKIACDLADLVIVTDDNPRSENPKIMRSDIIAGCDQSKIIEISNRKTAIEKSMQMLEESDILILAGKGHEKYQIIGEIKHDFDEELIVKNALTK